MIKIEREEVVGRRSEQRETSLSTSYPRRPTHDPRPTKNYVLSTHHHPSERFTRSNRGLHQDQNRQGVGAGIGAPQQRSPKMQHTGPLVHALGKPGGAHRATQSRWI